MRQLKEFAKQFTFTELLYLFGASMALVGYGFAASHASYVSTEAFTSGVIAGLPLGMLLLWTFQTLGKLAAVMAAAIEAEAKLIVEEIIESRDGKL